MLQLNHFVQEKSKINLQFPDDQPSSSIILGLQKLLILSLLYFENYLD